MTTTTSYNFKYSLEDYKNILFNGFDYEVPDTVLSIISEIALEVGSPQYIKTPVFAKKDTPKNDILLNRNNKRKRVKNNEIDNDEWNSIKNGNQEQSWSVVEKDNNIDKIIALLNKLTNATYENLVVKMKEIIGRIIEEQNEEEINKISNVIFDIASNNIFYSQLYAKLYADLICSYNTIQSTLENNFDNFINLFNNIEHCDPNKDYNKFCELNKTNEKRKSLSTFFVNLMDAKVISMDKIKNILKMLLFTMNQFIVEENKKGEVDELIENIVILCKKDLLIGCKNEHFVELNGMSIVEFISNISHSKTSNYKSLTNKTIFKCMDIMENINIV
jgi:hypothetical protein